MNAIDIGKDPMSESEEVGMVKHQAIEFRDNGYRCSKCPMTHSQANTRGIDTRVYPGAHKRFDALLVW